jgi:hypothetical protein
LLFFSPLFLLRQISRSLVGMVLPGSWCDARLLRGSWGLDGIGGAIWARA